MTWTLFWQIFILINWTTLLVKWAYGDIADDATLRSKILLDEARNA